MNPEQESVFRRTGPTRFVYWLGRGLPPALGMVVVWFVTGLLILVKPPVYDAVLDNLRHVFPAGTPWPEVRRTLRRLLFYRTKGYYDFFHNMGRAVPVTQLNPPVRLGPNVQRYIDEAMHSGRGLLIIGTHTSNYDLCGCALAEYLPVPPLVLSISDPAPGLQFINDVRNRARGEITPVTPTALRDAMLRLRQGGIVMTGVDRPLEVGNDPVTLFGATAMLPTGYIRIPLITDCLVMTVACTYDGSTYYVLANPPFEMERTGDRRRDEAVNLQRILTEVEEFVRQAPDEWMVFVPVWPGEAHRAEA
jgi:phosphatidylinositol dimannoside acyltransferase